MNSFLLIIFIIVVDNILNLMLMLHILWKWSSGWLESWEGLFFATDGSTTCTEAINNSPSQDSNHPDDLFQSWYVYSGCKLFSCYTHCSLSKGKPVMILQNKPPTGLILSLLTTIVIISFSVFGVLFSTTPVVRLWILTRKCAISNKLSRVKLPLWRSSSFFWIVLGQKNAINWVRIKSR